MPLSTIIGHRQIVDLLRQAVAHDRVPQSLLLAGPEGVGKHAVAVALAQAVNCPRRRPTSADACGTCPTCLRIARGQHSDVVVLDKGDDASIKIRVLRERLLDVVGYRPFEAARRVYIIDPADALTLEGQDALLKTLEEPPPSALVVLVTAFADALRPTIQSRCRRLRFGVLSERDLARVLAERAGVDPVKAQILAAVSGGSVARALAEAAGDLVDDREAALGLLVAAATGGSPQGRLKAATAFGQHGSKRRDREALATRLAIVASLIRDVGTLVLGLGVPGVLANVDLADPLREVAGGFDLERVSAAFSAVGRAQTALDRSASPKIVADWVALAI